MVRVGVPDFEDNEGKNARLIAVALDSFRTTFENGKEEEVRYCRPVTPSGVRLMTTCTRGVH